MTDNVDKHNYPTKGFFAAHKRFMTLEGQPWGDILDGPETSWEEVIEGIISFWDDAEFGFSRDDCRVWHIVMGKAPEDCTDLALQTAYETLQDRLEGF